MIYGNVYALSATTFRLMSAELKSAADVLIDVFNFACTVATTPQSSQPILDASAFLAKNDVVTLLLNDRVRHQTL